jgi:hypothetical protein
VERHGQLAIDETIRALLLTISAARSLERSIPRQAANRDRRDAPAQPEAVEHLPALRDKLSLGDLAAEDDGDLVRLADRAVGVEESLAQLVERGARIRSKQR